MNESAERTEEATPKKKLEARREGRIAKSSDMSAAASLTASGLLLTIYPETAAEKIQSFSTEIWSGAVSGSFPGLRQHIPAHGNFSFSNSAGSVLLESLILSALIIMPVIAIAIAGGISANLAQTKFLLSFKVISPNLNRINPLTGIKKLFSMERIMVMVRMAAAMILILLTCYVIIGTQTGSILKLAYSSTGVFAIFLSSFPKILFFCGLVLFIPAILDYFMAQRRLEKELRMTKQQIRDEQKREDGDPLFRNHRQNIHREMSSSENRPLKDARLLLVNPTRIAVALHHGEDIPVPNIGLKGMGERAADLRAEARSLGIPIIRNIKLARALFPVETGSSVPEPLFAATAAVLAMVYRAELANSQGRVLTQRMR